MDINDSFRSAYSALTTNPKGILPFYFFSVSIPVVLRIAPFVTAVFVYLALLRRGAIDEITEALGGIETDPEAFEENPEAAISTYTEQLEPVFELVFVPEVVVIVVVTVVVFAVAALVLNAVVGAAQVHALYSTLKGGEPIPDGISGARRDTRRFILLTFLEVALILAAVSVVGAIGFGAVATLGGLTAAAVNILLVLVLLFVVLFIHMLFIFAPQSVVIDDNGVLEAIRGNIDFVRENFVEFMAYIIFFIAAGIGFSAASGFFTALGAPTASAVVWLVVFSPFIGAVKVDMYTRHSRGERAIELGAVEPGLNRTVGAFRKGLHETASFAKSSIPYIGVVVVAFVCTAVAVWWYTASLSLGFETSIGERLETVSPIGSFFLYSTNNWTVATATVYSGMALGVPAITSVIFNGANLGFLAATESNPVELIAFVIPHGIIEIPTFLLSAALGLHLGVVVWRYLRGSLETEGITTEIERSYYIILGFAVLLVVAAVIEGFFSPYYYRLFL